MPDYDKEADRSVDRAFSNLMNWLDAYDKFKGDDAPSPDYTNTTRAHNEFAHKLRTNRTFDATSYRMRVGSTLPTLGNPMNMVKAIDNAVKHMSEAQKLTQKAATQARQGNKHANDPHNKLNHQAKLKAKAAKRTAAASKRASASATKAAAGKGRHGGRHGGGHGGHGGGGRR